MITLPEVHSALATDVQKMATRWHPYDMRITIKISQTTPSVKGAAIFMNWNLRATYPSLARKGRFTAERQTRREIQVSAIPNGAGSHTRQEIFLDLLGVSPLKNLSSDYGRTAA